jgi:hypothetical protein
MEPGDGLVSRWLGQLQGGDALVVPPLWQRYFHRLGGLARQRLRGSALWRLEVYTVEEIAARLGCVARSVKRKLHLIRTIWERELVS